MVVAGAGIIGASIAYHLAKAGATVTVIDKAGPATHASRGTFAWINATWAKQPQHYHALNQDGLADWKRLQQQLDLPIRWAGSLEWFDSPARQQQLALQIDEQQAWGEPARMIDSVELTTLEPNLRLDAVASAAYSPNDGAVDPVLATRALLSAAEQHGARIRYPVELQSVAMAGGRLRSIATSAGAINAARLVLATGAAPDASSKFAGIDVPQRSTPGVIAITEPVAPILHRVVSAPGIHLHQRDDGRFVLGEQDGAPDNVAHATRLKNRPNDFPSPELGAQHGNRLLLAARRVVPALEAAKIDSVFIGWRPLPLDGHPVLGFSPTRPDVYLAVMHSGVSLAPIVGQLAAHELTGGDLVPQLEPFRPTRDFQSIRRY